MEDISMRGAVVRISQDSMEAYLTLQPPEAGEGYTLSELVRYIRTQRVTNGIDEAAIQEMIDGGVYMRDVCIAKGQPPVNAENGRYELHFNPDVDGKPKVKEDGSIDYWSIRTVEMVKEGQTIATYYPPTEAVNGMNVSGKPILAVVASHCSHSAEKDFTVQKTEVLILQTCLERLKCQTERSGYPQFMKFPVMWESVQEMWNITEML